MKRRLALLLVTAMAVTTLAGCGGSSSSSSSDSSSDSAAASSETAEAAESDGGSDAGDKSLVFAWWGNQVRNERTQQILNMYCEENPGVTIDGQFAEFGDYWNKLATASAGHALPDVIQMDYKYLNQYVSNGLLVDLTPYIEDGTLDVSNCNEDVLNAGSVDGGVYAICNGINVPAMFYNKTLLDENGIEIHDNMTMDEFIEISKEVYDKTGYKTNLQYGSEQFLAYTLRADDITLWEDGKLGGDSADPYIEFMRLYEDGLADGYIISAEVFTERNIDSVEQNPLVYGSSPETMSWCYLAWSNQLSATTAAAPEGMEIGITTWPSKDPAKSDFLKPSQFFSVTTDSANPEEAAKIINYITNSVDCNNVLLGERGIPLSSTVAEAISPNLDEASQSIVTFINDVVSPTSSQINPPDTAGSTEVADLYKRLVEQVCYGQMTAEDAGNQLFTEGNSIMAENAQ